MDAGQQHNYESTEETNSACKAAGRQEFLLDWLGHVSERSYRCKVATRNGTIDSQTDSESVIT